MPGMTRSARSRSMVPEWRWASASASSPLAASSTWYPAFARMRRRTARTGASSSATSTVSLPRVRIAVLRSSSSGNSLVTGRRMRKVEPWPSTERTEIAPPASRTMSWAVARPRPVPLPASLVVKNGSKTRAATSGGMPLPSSVTAIDTYWPAVMPCGRASSGVRSTADVSTIMRPPAGIASRALTARLSRTCSSLVGSTLTRQRPVDSRISRSMSARKERRRSFSPAPMTSSSTTTRVRAGSRRPKASRCLVSSAARTAAPWICSTSLSTSLSRTASCTKEAKLLMTAMRLLKSCAPPPASCPMMASRSCWARRACCSRSSVTSRRSTAVPVPSGPVDEKARSASTRREGPPTVTSAASARSRRSSMANGPSRSSGAPGWTLPSSGRSLSACGFDKDTDRLRSSSSTPSGRSRTRRASRRRSRGAAPITRSGGGGAGEPLALQGGGADHLFGEERSIDGDGGLAGDDREEVEVLVAEDAACRPGIEVDEPDQLLPADHRHAHGRSDRLREQTGSAVEELVGARIGGHHARAGLDDLAQHAGGDGDLRLFPVAMAGDLRSRLQGHRIEEHDETAIGGQHPEGSVEDGAEQARQSLRLGERLGNLEGGAKLFVVATQLRGVRHLRGRQVGLAVQLPARARRFRVLGGFEAEAARADEQLVAVAKKGVGDPPIAAERPAAAAQVDDLVGPVLPAANLRVAWGDERIVHDHRARAIAADGGDRAELVPAIVFDVDEERHQTPANA